MLHTLSLLLLTPASREKMTELAISRSTVRRAGKKHGSPCTAERRHSFASVGSPLAVHWYGKLLPAVTGKEKIDRHAELVSGMDLPMLGENYQFYSFLTLPAGRKNFLQIQSSKH